MKVQVLFPKFTQSTKGNRFAHTSNVAIECEIVRDGLTVGHSTGAQVRILAKGAGYPIGHLVVVGESQIIR